jgi:hypothetical protein
MTSIKWLAAYDVTRIRVAATTGNGKSPEQCHRVVNGHQFDKRV